MDTNVKDVSSVSQAIEARFNALTEAYHKNLEKLNAHADLTGNKEKVMAVLQKSLASLVRIKSRSDRYLNSLMEPTEIKLDQTQLAELEAYLLNPLENENNLSTSTVDHYFDQEAIEAAAFAKLSESIAAWEHQWGGYLSQYEYFENTRGRLKKFKEDVANHAASSMELTQKWEELSKKDFEIAIVIHQDQRLSKFVIPLKSIKVPEFPPAERIPTIIKTPAANIMNEFSSMLEQAKSMLESPQFLNLSTTTGDVGRAVNPPPTREFTEWLKQSEEALAKLTPKYQDAVTISQQAHLFSEFGNTEIYQATRTFLEKMASEFQEILQTSHHSEKEKLMAEMTLKGSEDFFKSLNDVNLDHIDPRLTQLIGIYNQFSTLQSHYCEEVKNNITIFLNQTQDGFYRLQKFSPEKREVFLAPLKKDCKTMDTKYELQVIHQIQTLLNKKSSILEPSLSKRLFDWMKNIFSRWLGPQKPHLQTSKELKAAIHELQPRSVNITKRLREDVKAEKTQEEVQSENLPNPKHK